MGRNRCSPGNGAKPLSKPFLFLLLPECLHTKLTEPALFRGSSFVDVPLLLIAAPVDLCHFRFPSFLLLSPMTLICPGPILCFLPKIHSQLTEECIRIFVVLCGFSTLYIHFYTFLFVFLEWLANFASLKAIMSRVRLAEKGCHFFDR